MHAHPSPRPLGVPIHDNDEGFPADTAVIISRKP